MLKCKVGELKHCRELYPRRDVDPDHVDRLVDAIEAGAELPPIIVCRRTLRMADGNHRAAAISRRYGPDHEVTCIEKDYKNDAAFFLDAIHLNGAHGLLLGPRDRQWVMEVADELKIDFQRVAGALRMTPDAAATLRTRVIADPKVTAAKATHPFKRNGKPVRNPAHERQKLTDKLDSVIRFLKSGDFDPTDEEVVSRVRVMNHVINELFATLSRGERRVTAASGPTFRSGDRRAGSVATVA